MMRTISGVGRARAVRLVALTALVAMQCALRAQSDQAPVSSPAAETTAPTGSFTINGSTGVGYRMADVTGSDPMYRELFNLNSGARLVDFSLFGRAASGAHPFADAFSLTASGLGGDPFSGVQVTARKNRVYDLRVTWRHSQYVWDQSNATLPNGQNGLTDNHSWNTVRDFGTASLLLHLTNDLRVGMNISRMNDAGDIVTTRAPDFFGSPSSWGTFVRANPYQMDAPLDETVNRYTGAIDYTRSGWTVHYNGGYQTFDDSVTAAALSTPERSIDVDDPLTASEPLQEGAYQDFRRLTTPISELSYDGKLAPNVEWRGGYLFYRYSGPAGLQASYDGSARSGSTFVPYTLSLDTRSQVTEPTHVLQQGVTWDASDRVSLLADYEYTHVGIDTDASFETLFGSTLGTGETTERWRENRHQLDLDVEITPSHAWLIRGGLRWMRNDVLVLEDGVVDPVRTSTISTLWPTVSASYKPSERFNVRGDLDAVNNDTSYTRITPHAEVGSRLMVTLKPTDALSIQDTMRLRTETLDASDYRDRVRSNAVVATFALNDEWSAFGGYSLDSIVSTGTSTFLRGPAPLDVTIDDNEFDHVWQGGVSVKARRAGFDLSGNYVRTTGQGVITGELPRYGTTTFPCASGTLYYEFPGVGRLSIDVQRIRYAEATITADNFRARVVMIRWSRDF